MYKKEDYTYTNYAASYYTATAVNGTLDLYIEPTKKTMTEITSTFLSEAGKTWTVLQRAYAMAGESWSLISDGETSAWVQSNQPSFSNTQQSYQYPVTVQENSYGVAYAGENGAHLYSMASSLSELLCVIPKMQK